MRRKLKEKFIYKLKSKRGETITETLISLLIIALAMTMLAGAIVSAAKVNKQVKDSKTAFTTENIEDGTVSTNVTTVPGQNKVTVTHNAVSSATITPAPIYVDVTATTDNNKYVYYSEK